jgi:hypothetical protein
MHFKNKIKLLENNFVPKRQKVISAKNEVEERYKTLDRIKQKGKIWETRPPL